MTNSSEFPNSIYEFLLDNSFKDIDEVYTNGSLLIPTFRVKQAIEHYYPCEDAISREAVIRLVEQYPNIIGNRCSGLIADIKHLPSVTPSYNSIKIELEPCEDALSRKRLIILIDEGAELHPYKVVGDSETYSNYNQGWTDAFDWLYANIDCDNLPSVKPQQENGEWIEVWDKDHLVILAYKCSECGSMRNAKTSYCADCGADMRGEEK